MKRSMILYTVLLLSFFQAAFTFAAEHEATLERGKALFNDPKLGANGRSCNDCHKSGAGLEQAAKRKDLEDMVNGCIVVNLKGKALGPDSVEMRSLLLYIRSLEAGKRQLGRKPAVGC